MDAKATNPVRTNSAAPRDMLMEDLRHVVADAEELLRATATQAGEGAAFARAHIQDSLKAAKARLLEARGGVIERAREAANITDQYAHDNPWKLIGVSAVAGAVIGMLIARR